MTPSIFSDLGTSVANAASVGTGADSRHTAVMLSSFEVVRLQPLPPILFVKTHKTGGSTVRGIIVRMGERRNLSFMFPVDNAYLGYPGPFPGDPQISLYGRPRHQFDIICNEAVLNASLMSAYLKPHPHVLTIVREPTGHMMSSKNYYFPTWSWDAYLALVEHPETEFRWKNMQSFDLGWYDFVGGSTEYDTDQTKISAWLATLDSVLMTKLVLEYFEQGLALWGQKVQVDLEELAYLVENPTTTKIAPTEGQLHRLAVLGNVDRALYSHLNESFWQEWFRSDVSKLEANVVTLKNLNEELQHACDEGDSERCPASFTMKGPAYTAILKRKQEVQGL